MKKIFNHLTVTTTEIETASLSITLFQTNGLKKLFHADIDRLTNINILRKAICKYKTSITLRITEGSLNAGLWRLAFICVRSHRHTDSGKLFFIYNKLNVFYLLQAN